MEITGYIYPDGSVKLLNCEPEKTRVVGITGKMIAIHHPGGTYYTNGGQQYASSWIQVDELAELRKVDDRWFFRCVKMGKSMSFHPTPTKAVSDALHFLKYQLKEPKE